MKIILLLLFKDLEAIFKIEINGINVISYSSSVDKIQQFQAMYQELLLCCSYVGRTKSATDVVPFTDKEFNWGIFEFLT